MPSGGDYMGWPCLLQNVIVWCCFYFSAVNSDDCVGGSKSVELFLHIFSPCG